MAHKHSVYDTEPHFQIDKTSREIKNVSNSKTTITQFDHNSERFTFEIPRFIDSHDMSLCNKVQVHYINIDSTDKNNQNIGVYTVDDLQLSPDDENIVICSWLISQNATQLAGSLVFLLRFACVTDDVLDYAWNTSRCTNISVSNGLYNGEAIIEEYFDILATWEQNIVADVTVGIDEAIETKIDNIKLVETATGNAITIDSSEAPIPYMKLSGKTTQNGTPTPDAPVPIVSVGDSGSFEVGVYGGKNFVEITTDTKTSAGVTFTRNADNSFSLSGTGNANNVYNIGRAYLIQGTSYKLTGCASGGASNSYLIRVIGNNNVTVAEDLGSGKTFTPTTTGFYTVAIRIQSGTVTDGLKFYPMIRLATETDSTYEPCNKQTLTMPYNLPSMPNTETKNEVDFGKGVHNKKVVSYTFDGSENWTLSASGTRRFVINNGIYAKRGVGISSHFTQAVETDLCFWVSGASGAFTIYDVNGKWADLNTFKTWLSENKPIFLLELVTPTETPLTETELNAYRHLMTNKGNTTILSEADMEILYYVNKPNAQVIGNIHTQINKDYLKSHSTLQSEG